MTAKKALLRGVLGFPLGVFVGSTMTVINSMAIGEGIYHAVAPKLVQTMGTELTAVILQYFMCGILGFTFAISTVIFSIDRWSFTKQTIFHFLLVSIIMSFVTYICQWVEYNIILFFVWYSVFFGVYLIIWVVQYVFWKSKIKAVNQKLK